MELVKNIQRTVPAIVSTIFHPLLIPTIGILFLFTSNSWYSYTPLQYKRMMYLITFCLTCVLPALMIIALSFKKKISFSLSGKKDTFILLIVLSVFYIVSGVVVGYFNLISGFRIFFVGITVALVVGLVLNFWTRVSVSLISTGSFAGIFCVLGMGGSGNFIYPFITFVLAGGLIGSVCLIRKTHSPAQIYLSYLLGFNLLYFIFNVLT